MGTLIKQRIHPDPGPVTVFVEKKEKKVQRNLSSYDERDRCRSTNDAFVLSNDSVREDERHLESRYPLRSSIAIPVSAKRLGSSASSHPPPLSVNGSTNADAISPTGQVIFSVLKRANINTKYKCGSRVRRK